MRRFLVCVPSICWLVPAAAGCSISDLQTPQRMEQGLVVILPGIEGRSRHNVNIARGLEDGGVKVGIEMFDWGTAVPGGMLINLTDYDRNQRVARGLRERILRYRRQHPDRCIHLIGHSGGAGLALMATEALPRDVQVTSVILLAPAVSPKYDLRRALRRTRYGIFSYYSKHDRGYLVLGTSLFGTVDRRYGPSAGAVGFEPIESEDPDDEALYAKLHQVSWRPLMRRYGHGGGHLGWTERRFVCHYLAPLINDLGSQRWLKGVVPAPQEQPMGPGRKGAEAAREASARFESSYPMPVPAK